MNTSHGSFYLTRPDVLLRLEGLLSLVVGCVAYQRICPGHWGTFALLFLVPDISLLGYLRSASKGSADFYNAVHSYVLPLAVGLFAWRQGSSLTGQLVLIWLSHISFDRCIGYGPKFPEVFGYTHIQSSARIDERSFPSKV
jgi:Domain of unknown function (DUF4260)